MKTRALGTQGLACSAIGLGCMGMSHVYGPASDRESVAAIHRALEVGVSLLDTADVYGFNGNEVLLRKALEGRREQAVLATKFGMRRKPDGTLVGIDGSPDYVRQACEGSLERLGTEVIDLYYLHRVDPKVPIEDTIGAMSRLVAEGKVRYLGLSEVGPDTLRRAHAVHPISAVQSEYSLWTRDPEETLLPVLRALDVGFVAYSPLGRGMLTGSIQTAADLSERDYRRTFPRYQEENLAHNAALLDPLLAIAGEIGASPTQVCLAWLLAQGEDIVPIPGTKRTRYVEENAAAATLDLDAEYLRRIGSALPLEAVRGARFREAAMARLEQ